MSAEDSDRRRGQMIVIYRAAAVVLLVSTVAQIVSRDDVEAMGFLAAWLALVVAMTLGDLRQSERDRRASDAALLDAHAALQEAHAEIRASHDNIKEILVTEEQMRAHVWRGQEEQR